MKKGNCILNKLLMKFSIISVLMINIFSINTFNKNETNVYGASYSVTCDDSQTWASHNLGSVSKLNIGDSISLSNDNGDFDFNIYIDDRLLISVPAGEDYTFEAKCEYDLSLDSAKELFELYLTAHYPVKYDLNGGSGTCPSNSDLYEVGDTITLSDGSGFSKTGNKFLGWTINSDSTVITNSYTVDADDLSNNEPITFYAAWETVRILHCDECGGDHEVYCVYYDEECHEILCGYCDEWIADEDHDFVDNVCIYCNYNKGECTVNHDEVGWTYNDDEHWKICDSCEEKWGRGSHDTNGEGLSCSVCGYGSSSAREYFCEDCESYQDVYYEDDDMDSHDIYCKRCDSYLDYGDHEYNEGICIYCGHDENAECPGDHDNIPWSYDTEEHWKSCDECGELHLFFDSHDYNDDEICKVCGMEMPHAILFITHGEFDEGEEPSDDEKIITKDMVGTTYTIPGNTGNMVKYGYYFIGWNTDENATTGLETVVIPSKSNLELYPIWEDLSYQEDVTLSITNVKYGTKASDISISVSDTKLSVESYALYKGSYNPETKVDEVNGSGNYYVVAALTFTSTDKAYYFASTYFSAFGSFVYPGEFSIDNGNDGGIRACKEYSFGSTFSYTQASEDEGYKQNVLIAIIKFYGNTVTYDDNVDLEEIDVPIDENTYLEGAPITVSTTKPTRNNWFFVGWNTDASATKGLTFTDGKYTMGDSNVTLYAIWTDKETIDIDTDTVQRFVYDGNDKTPVLKDSEGKLITLSDFNFDYEMYGNTSTEFSSCANTKEPGLYKAHITRDADDTHEEVDTYIEFVVTYSLTYKANTGVGDDIVDLANDDTIHKDYFGPHCDDDSETYLFDKKAIIKANTYTLENYSFAFWNTKADGTGTSYNPEELVTLKGNTILYACYSANISAHPNKDNDYSVSVATDDSVTYVWEKVSQVKTAFNFSTGVLSGTYDSSNGTITSIKQGDTYQIRLLGKLDKKLSFYTEGTLSDGVAGENNTYIYSAKLSKTAFYLITSSSEFTISDINLYETAYVEITNETANSISLATENTTYRCVVKSKFNAISYSNTITTNKISFNGNDATGTDPSAMYQLEGRKITMPSNTYSKSGYRFVGWNTDESATAGLSFDNGKYTVGNSDVTFYAIWAEKLTISVDQDTQYFNVEAKASDIVFNVTGTNIPTSGLNISYRKNGTSNEFSANLFETAQISTYYDVKITYAGDDTHKALDLTITKGLALYISVIYHNTDATSGTVPTDSTKYIYSDLTGIKRTTALSNSGNLVRTGYDFDGWYYCLSNASSLQFVDAIDETGNINIKGMQNNINVYPNWALSVKDISKDNDYTVKSDADLTNCTYQWSVESTYCMSDMEMGTSTTVNNGTKDYYTADGDLSIWNEEELFFNIKYYKKGCYLKVLADKGLNCGERKGDYYYCEFSDGLVFDDYFSIILYYEADYEDENDKSTILDFEIVYSQDIPGETNARVESIIEGQQAYCVVSYSQTIQGIKIDKTVKTNSVEVRTISFDGNGATSGSIDPLYSLYGRSITIPTNTYTNGDYTFAGFNTNKIAPSGLEFKNGKYEVLETNTKFYAIWNHISDGITYGINLNEYCKINPDMNLIEGNYYLSSDLSLNEALNTAAAVKVNICLNGYTLTFNTGETFDIESGSNITFTDCKHSNESHGKLIIKKDLYGTNYFFKVLTTNDLKTELAFKNIDVDVINKQLICSEFTYNTAFTFENCMFNVDAATTFLYVSSSKNNASDITFKNCIINELVEDTEDQIISFIVVFSLDKKSNINFINTNIDSKCLVALNVSRSIVLIDENSSFIGYANSSTVEANQSEITLKGTIKNTHEPSKNQNSFDAEWGAININYETDLLLYDSANLSSTHGVDIYAVPTSEDGLPRIIIKEKLTNINPYIIYNGTDILYENELIYDFKKYNPDKDIDDYFNVVMDRDDFSIPFLKFEDESKDICSVLFLEFTKNLSSDSDEVETNSEKATYSWYHVNYNKDVRLDPTTDFIAEELSGASIEGDYFIATDDSISATYKEPFTDLTKLSAYIVADEYCISMKDTNNYSFCAISDEIIKFKLYILRNGDDEYSLVDDSDISFTQGRFEDDYFYSNVFVSDDIPYSSFDIGFKESGTKYAGLSTSSYTLKIVFEDDTLWTNITGSLTNYVLDYAISEGMQEGFKFYFTTDTYEVADKIDGETSNKVPANSLPGYYLCRAYLNENYINSNVYKIDLFNISLSEEATEKTYNGSSIGYELKGDDKDLSDFVIEYYFNQCWNKSKPTDAGSYDVRISREEDSVYNEYSKTITDGLVIKPYVVEEKDITLCNDDFTYNGENQLDSLTCSYKNINGDTIELEVYNCAPTNVNRSIGQFKNAGEYEVTFRCRTSEETNNYRFVYDDDEGKRYYAYFTMKKADYNMENAKWNYTEAFTYDNSEKEVLVVGLPDGVTVNEYTNNSYINAGNYVASVTFDFDKQNYNEPTINDLNWTINKIVVNEPTINETYTYTGEVIIPTLSNFESYMFKTGTLSATEAGVYTINISLDDNYTWNANSDGVITWEIKATSITSETKESENSNVVVSSDEGFASSITVVVEVTVEVEVESKELTVDYYDIDNDDVKLSSNEKVGVIFDVKLIQTIDGVSQEIQPSDIKDGTVIKVKMLIPDSVDVSKVVRILHVHSKDDIEEIAFDASKIDENGYYEIEVNRLSEFAFIYKTNCINHWFLLGILVLLIGFVVVLWSGFDIKKFINKDSKVNVAPIIGFAIHLIALVVLSILSSCSLCVVFIIINALALIGFIVVYLLPTKDNKQEENNSNTNKEEDENKETSLKDAIILANDLNANVKLCKKVIADYLEENYSDVIVNRRNNYISSGILPLSDTHYRTVNNKKICFVYVFELRNGNTFMLVKANKDLAEKIMKEHTGFAKSAFPKTVSNDWYTMIIDDSYKNTRQVLDVLDQIYYNVE